MSSMRQKIICISGPYGPSPDCEAALIGEEGEGSEELVTRALNDGWKILHRDFACPPCAKVQADED